MTLQTFHPSGEDRDQNTVQISICSNEIMQRDAEDRSSRDILHKGLWNNLSESSVIIKGRNLNIFFCIISSPHLTWEGRKVIYIFAVQSNPYLTFSSHSREINIPKARPVWIWTAWDSSAFGFPGSMATSIFRTSSTFSLWDTIKTGTETDKANSAQDRVMALAVFSPE